MTGAPMQVLCVEDDRINALLMRELCRQAGGIEARFAETCAEALTLASQSPPDLLILDMNLPDGDGMTLLPRLRDAAARPDVPAVLCTAELISDVEDQARTAGFDACWPKPVTLDAVLGALRRYADGVAARAAPPATE